MYTNIHPDILLSQFLNSPTYSKGNKMPTITFGTQDINVGVTRAGCGKEDEAMLMNDLEGNGPVFKEILSILENGKLMCDELFVILVYVHANNLALCICSSVYSFHVLKRQYHDYKNLNILVVFKNARQMLKTELIGPEK